MAKKLSILGFIGAFLIAIALINWGLVFYFNFNLVDWMTFGIRWLAGIVYTFVLIIGLISLGELLYKVLR